VFTGFVDWHEVYKLYCISNLFATASLSEVHPMTMIEALICALPTVARRDDSYLDLVLEGKNGYLCDSDAEMTAKIEELLSDKARMLEFSAFALRHSEQFSAERHVDKMLRLYQTIIDYSKTNPAS
jgi:1,2-diacylglycerol 3-alpha-glucosyltransferase